MIEVYEGRLGGGKTYTAVHVILAHLAAGGTVCTNIDLIWSAICKLVAARFGVVLEDDQLIKIEDEQVCDFHKFTPRGTAETPVLVALDEAHIHFNARDFAQTDKHHRETLIFLTQSRKEYTNIIFISQSIFNMDKQFARLVQYVWRFRDMSKWRIPGLGIMSPFKGILAVQFDYDGKTVLQRQFVNKDKGIFGCYNTNSLIRGFPRLEGVRTSRKLQKVQTDSTASKVALAVIVLIDVIVLWLALAL